MADKYETLNFTEQGGARTEIGGVIDVVTGGAIKIAGTDKTAAIAALPVPANYAVGVAASYKVARGLHTQVAAADTVATGLTTVVAVVASWESAPTVKQLHVQASIGNQAGAPVAGSVIISTFKPTANDNATPVAASDFSENLKIAWVAIGT